VVFFVIYISLFQCEIITIILYIPNFIFPLSCNCFSILSSFVIVRLCEHRSQSYSPFWFRSFVHPLSYFHWTCFRYDLRLYLNNIIRNVTHSVTVVLITMLLIYSSFYGMFQINFIDYLKCSRLFFKYILYI